MKISGFFIGIIVVLIASISITLIHQELYTGYASIGIEKEQMLYFSENNFNKTSEIQSLTEDMRKVLQNENSTMSSLDYTGAVFLTSFKVMGRVLPAGLEIFYGIMESFASVLGIPPSIVVLALAGITIVILFAVVSWVVNRDV